MVVDLDEPAIYIYDNPDFDSNSELDIYNSIRTQEGQQMLIEQVKDKNKEIENKRILMDDIIEELEIGVLSLIHDYGNDYMENQILLREKIKSNSNLESKRMCLIYLLGGSTLGYHFFNQDGSFKSEFELEEEITKLLSWKGMTFHDYFTLNKIWKNINITTWTLLKIMNNSQFVKDYLYHWFKNTYVKNLSLAAGSLFFSYFASNPFKKIMVSISLFVIGYLLLYLYEGAYTVEEVNIINKNYDSINKNNGIDKKTKENIIYFKKEYFQLETEINKLRSLPDEEIEHNIQEHITKKNIFQGKHKDNKLVKFLLKYLYNNYTPNEMYVDIRKNAILIPLAIYFFNKKGEVRPVRDIICCIIIMAMSFRENEYRHLKNPQVVSNSRKSDLVGKTFFGGSPTNYILKSRKRKKSGLKKTLKQSKL